MQRRHSDCFPGHMISVFPPTTTRERNAISRVFADLCPNDHPRSNKTSNNSSSSSHLSERKKPKDSPPTTSDPQTAVHQPVRSSIRQEGETSNATVSLISTSLFETLPLVRVCQTRGQPPSCRGKGALERLPSLLKLQRHPYLHDMMNGDSVTYLTKRRPQTARRTPSSRNSGMAKSLLGYLWAGSCKGVSSRNNKVSVKQQHFHVIRLVKRGGECSLFISEWSGAVRGRVAVLRRSDREAGIT